MADFNVFRNEVITTSIISNKENALESFLYDPSIPIFGSKNKDKALSVNTDDGKNLTADDLSDQFLVYQLGSKKDEAAVLEASQVVPAIDGSEEHPDIKMNIQMQSFHVGSNEKIGKKTKATLRLDIGKDKSSRDKYFDTVFWSIAAGLDLYNNYKKKNTESKELKSDFQKAFGNRPIEIPGGLSELSFSVMKHKEEDWWDKVFSFLRSPVGDTLISTIGFPAITKQAINVVDQLIDRIQDKDKKPLFQGRSMRLALSQQAKDDYTAGNERIPLGSINPGFLVLARGRDFEKFVDSNAIYYPHYGKLVPADVKPADLLAGRYDDPLKNVTYAVIKVGMAKAKLDPNFNYGQS